MSALVTAEDGFSQPVDMLNAAILDSRGGNIRAARDAMRAIASAWPDWDEPWVRLGQSLREAGERGQAMAAYEAALARNPHRAEALVSLGVLRLQSGDHAEAHALLEKAVALFPKSDESWAAYGFLLMREGLARDAAAAFHCAAALAPDRLRYALDEAEALATCGETGAAEALALDRLAANPLDGVAACIAGRAAWARGDVAEAEALLETAQALLPDEVPPLALLGTLHASAMRSDRAEEFLRAAHEMAPEDFDIAHNLSVTLYRLYRFAEADTILSAAISRSGATAMALASRATQRAALGDLESALLDLREAAKLDPKSINPLRARCTLLAYHPDTTGPDLRQEMEAAARLLPRPGATPPLANARDPERKLRIGLLSNSLSRHPVGWLTLAGIEQLDPDAFSIHCFGLFDEADTIAKRYARRAESWDDCAALDDDAVAARIRERGIDIAIDLGGYGDAGRIDVLVRRPAPVQIKWVGMQCSTTGIPEIDWFITDRWETPAGFEPLYTERLLRLDDGYICYLPPAYAPDVTPLPALENGCVTFGCFNNLAKLTEGTLTAWAAILGALPQSRLVLRCPQLSEPSTAARLEARCAAAGIDLARLDFQGRTPHREFLAGYNRIDIALDPFPYSGGLTTCEALHMGVPVITRAGEIFAARHSVSHLSNAGLEDWVAVDEADYVARAVRFARDLPALAALRAGLRQQVLASPLCDAPRFGRSLGKALRHAWRAWCEEPR